LAPGNWVRAARVPDVERTLTIVLLKSALSFVKWFSLWILDPALWSASVLLVPSVVAIYRKSPQWKRIPSSKPFLIISVVVWLILTFAPFFISLFAGGYIPRRTVNTSYLIFLLGWFGCLGISSLVLADKKSHWIQFIIPPSYIRSAAQWVLILVLVLVGRFPGAAKDLLVYAPIADVQLKNRLMIIRQSGTHGDIVVPPLESIPHTILNEDTLTPNAELFYNKCQAEFFRVRSVVTSSP
jgi:hypothetical protein